MILYWTKLKPRQIAIFFVCHHPNLCGRLPLSLRLDLPERLPKSKMVAIALIRDRFVFYSFHSLLSCPLL